MKAHHTVHEAKHPAKAVKLSDPSLRKHLLAMYKADQDVRNAWIKAGLKLSSPQAKRMEEVDANNLVRLKKILAANGFPTLAMVGKEGVHAAFILVQHATRDPALQEHVLLQLEKLYKRGDVTGQDFAMLTDRVLLGQGKPQIYGTQFISDKNTHGEIMLRPIRDVAHVDSRRASVGLPPLKMYACVLSHYYNKPFFLARGEGQGR